MSHEFPGGATYERTRKSRSPTTLTLDTSRNLGSLRVATTSAMASWTVSNSILSLTTRHSRRLSTPLARSAACRWQSSPGGNAAANETQEPMYTPSASLPPPLLERSEKNFFQKLHDKYSFSQQTNRILMAESFLQAATRQASDPRWFGPGRIGRDFRSFQALMTMHIWFLHKRLIADQEDPHRASLIQEELFDIFWTDSSNRMRAHGVNEMSIQKNLKTVQQYSFMHLFHYDHCYTELLDSPEERLEELKNLVLIHILLLNPDDPKALEMHDDHAERLAWYIETQYQNIVHDLPDELYRKARIAWVDLPDFSQLKEGTSGKILEENPIDPDDILPRPWLRNIANDGTYYYWNEETREAKWERPN